MTNAYRVLIVEDEVMLALELEAELQSMLFFLALLCGRRSVVCCFGPERFLAFPFA